MQMYTVHVKLLPSQTLNHILGFADPIFSDPIATESYRQSMEIVYNRSGPNSYLIKILLLPQPEKIQADFEFSIPIVAGIVLYWYNQ